jgi:hypothetical protein
MSPPRRRSGLWVLLVVVLVAALLVAGLAYADGRIRRQVETEAARTLQSRLGTPRPPQVSIDGFPFLTQVALQSLRTVRVVADQVGLTTEAPLVVEHVDLVLTDVVSTDRFATLTASHLEGTALVGYDQLPALAGVPMTYGGNGLFRVETTTMVLSVPVRAVVTGGLGLNVGEQTVSLTNPEVAVAGVDLPDLAAQALVRAVARPIPIRGIPFDLQVTALQPLDDGLHANLAGDNVALSR